MTPINVALGIVAVILAAFTIRSQIRKTKADADSVEIGNIRNLITTWEESANKFKKKADEAEARESKVLAEVDSLRREVIKLTNIQKKIVTLLDKITHENLETVVRQIKNELQPTHETTT
jgi:uncharacterized coiled-coil DUF342 family protein